MVILKNIHFNVTSYRMDLHCVTIITYCIYGMYSLLDLFDI